MYIYIRFFTNYFRRSPPATETVSQTFVAQTSRRRTLVYSRRITKPAHKRLPIHVISACTLLLLLSTLYYYNKQRKPTRGFRIIQKKKTTHYTTTAIILQKKKTYARKIIILRLRYQHFIFQTPRTKIFLHRNNTIYYKYRGVSHAYNDGVQ